MTIATPPPGANYVPLLLALIIGAGVGGFVAVILGFFGSLADPSAMATTRYSFSDFPVDSRAFTDISDCPEGSADDFVGAWEGEPAVVGGQTQQWAVHRKPDGTATINFTFTEDGRVVKTNTEQILWSYSRCLYATAILNVNDVPVLYVETYRVHSVGPDRIEYTSLRTGTEFVVNKMRIETP